MIHFNRIKHQHFISNVNQLTNSLVVSLYSMILSSDIRLIIYLISVSSFTSYFSGYNCWWQYYLSSPFWNMKSIWDSWIKCNILQMSWTMKLKYNDVYLFLYFVIFIFCSWFHLHNMVQMNLTFTFCTKWVYSYELKCWKLFSSLHSINVHNRKIGKTAFLSDINFDDFFLVQNSQCFYYDKIIRYLGINYFNKVSILQWILHYFFKIL